jgi:chemosensory pili system protein ChpE
MIQLLLSAIVAGIAFCAPPGVVAAETIRRGGHYGFRAGLWVQAGSLIGDATWCILALSGMAFLVQNPLAKNVLGVVGLVLLVYLAGSALRDAWRGGELSVSEKHLARNDFSTGAALALGNPLNIVFWLGLGTSMLTTHTTNPQWTDYLTFFSGFMLGAVLWAFLMAGAVAYLRRWLTPQLFRIVNLVCGLALLYFAVQMVRSLWG